MMLWGGVIWFTFIFVNFYEKNDLRAGAASMDCISPLHSEMSAAVPSAFCPWM